MSKSFPINFIIVYFLAMDKTIQLKVIVIGDSSVGKSSLLRKFHGEEFDENSRPTVALELYSIKRKFRGKEVILKVCIFIKINIYFVIVLGHGRTGEIQICDSQVLFRSPCCSCCLRCHFARVFQIFGILVSRA